ncbi:MAG TPA: hypothetical protein DEB06_07360, partial [Phycisphaerales bacterium]|nr:hypothetical protein [Phycisphaerales bacterium]
MPHASQGVTPDIEGLMEQAGALARASGAFAAVTVHPTRVDCTDPVQPEALFRFALDAGALTVNWVSADRYLSQSIEAELRWTRESIDDLMDEELADRGFDGSASRMTHFRDAEKCFVFRWELPIPPRGGADRGEPDRGESDRGESDGGGESDRGES